MGGGAGVRDGQVVAARCVLWGVPTPRCRPTWVKPSVASTPAWPSLPPPARGPHPPTHWAFYPPRGSSIPFKGLHTPTPPFNRRNHVV